MRTPVRTACAPLLLALFLPLAGKASLPEYVTRPEPEFSWKKDGEEQLGSLKLVTLTMRSQVWRGIAWDHTIQLFLPEKVTHPKTALMLITGGKPNASSALLAAVAVPRLEAPVAILYDIPNQPLLGGKREDDLIAHTFQEYLESGDATWPLLFPMVKSAVRAMDAVQQFSKKELKEPIEGFVVTGASKRGWTTYLTGSVDNRVRGIAPMVFDNLNFQAQMPRQLELWGRYSEQIEDYTRRGLQQKMDTERGRKLISMVDPWHYRERLQMPKLLIHGSNDRYWATDATGLYWKDLPGAKYLLSVPNAGHGLNDQLRVLSTLSAFFKSVCEGAAMPRVSLASKTEGQAVRVRVESDVPPGEVRLWVTRAADLDFRPAKWDAAALELKDGAYSGSVDLPASGDLALFAEATYGAAGGAYTLTTVPEVHGKRP